MDKGSFIYFVQSGYTGAIKIGVANNVRMRICDLQVGNPMELKLLASIGPYQRGAALKLEGELHRKFKHKRVRGEWFHRTINLKSIEELEIDVDVIFDCPLKNASEEQLLEDFKLFFDD